MDSDEVIESLNLPDTDGAETTVVLAVLKACAECWEYDARIIGNIRAGDIVRALQMVFREEDKPVPVSLGTHETLLGVKPVGQKRSFPTPLGMLHVSTIEHERAFYTRVENGRDMFHFDQCYPAVKVLIEFMKIFHGRTFIENTRQ